jgi:transcriptional regulator with XRE-family HTH domain
MKSRITEILPRSVWDALHKIGEDLSIARRKRSLTIAMMAERVGVSLMTYRRAERGDPTVSMGVYAMALYVLGLGDRVRDLVDPRHDDQGLLLDEDNLPKRIRTRRQPLGL